MLQWGFVRSNFSFAIVFIPVQKGYLDPVAVFIAFVPQCALKPGAGDGSRTRATSLEGWRSTTELHPRANSVFFSPSTRFFHRRILRKRVLRGSPLFSPHRDGGGGWIRTNVDVRQRVYSPSPLATRAPLRNTGQASTQRRQHPYVALIGNPVPDVN